MMTHTGPHLVQRIQPLFLALLALLAVGGVMAVVSPVLPRTSNCPAGSLPVLGSTPCCPAGYALTQLDANVPAACQPFTCCSGGSCTNDQVICGVLGDLYYGLGGSSIVASTSLTGLMDGWINAANPIPTDYCTFYGLTCDSSGSLKVINLMEASGGAGWGCNPGQYSMTGRGIYMMGGSVPNSTGLLGPSVTDISINGLNPPWGGPAGPLSWIDNLSMGHLTSLTCIEFHGNLYTGSLPSSIPPNLLKLSIYDVTHPTPGPLSLALLGLVVNPAAFPAFDVSQVPGLALDWAELALLPSTTTAVVVTETPITRVYPSLAFTAGSLPDLSALTALVSLVLQNQGSLLTGSIPDMFAGMTALASLDLSGNALSGKLPASAVVQCFRMGSCSFGGGSNAVSLNTSALASLPASTQTISLVGVPWGLSSVTGVLPNLATITALTSLVIRNHGSSLSGTIPDMFGGMTLLTNLDLRSNSLTGSLPQSLILLCLKPGVTCNLGGSNNFSTSNLLPAFPVNITSFAGFWGITLAAMPDLSSFTSLTSISLSGVGLTGTIPSWLSSLTALQSLDLSSNALNGTIPDFFGSTPALTYLRLSSNSLVGSLPLSFGNLGSAVIQVDGNHGLNGSVPASILTSCAAILAFYPISYTPQGNVCQFYSTSLVLPPLSGGGSGSGSSFDPTSLLASIASLTATVNSLQVNLTNAQAACSAAG